MMNKKKGKKRKEKKRKRTKQINSMASRVLRKAATASAISESLSEVSHSSSSSIKQNLRPELNSHASQALRLSEKQIATPPFAYSFPPIPPPEKLKKDYALTRVSTVQEEGLETKKITFIKSSYLVNEKIAGTFFLCFSAFLCLFLSCFFLFFSFLFLFLIDS